MRQHGGQSVVTLDSEVEGRGRECAAVARRLTDTLELSLLKNKKGRSPDDTAWAVETERHDLVFIDGDHRYPQVKLDFEAVLPYTGASTVFVWHDFWLPGIFPCLRAAANYGFRWLWLPTSCEMVLGVRDAAAFTALQEIFTDGIENQKAPSSLLAPAILTKALAQQVWESATNRFIPAKSVRQTE
jgi:hypothetical protein